MSTVRIAALALVLAMLAPGVTVANGDECVHLMFLPLADELRLIVYKVGNALVLGIEFDEQDADVMAALIVNPADCGADPGEIQRMLADLQQGPSQNSSPTAP